MWDRMRTHRVFVELRRRGKERGETETRGEESGYGKKTAAGVEMEGTLEKLEFFRMFVSGPFSSWR